MKDAKGVVHVRDDQLAALRVLAGLGAQWEWITSDMVDEALPPGTNSTPVMAPLAQAGLVRRIHYGRRFAYQLADPGQDALNRAGQESRP